MLFSLIYGTLKIHTSRIVFKFHMSIKNFVKLSILRCQEEFIVDKNTSWIFKKHGNYSWTICLSHSYPLKTYLTANTLSQNYQFQLFGRAFKSSKCTKHFTRESNCFTFKSAWWLNIYNFHSHLEHKYWAMGIDKLSYCQRM